MLKASSKKERKGRPLPVEVQKRGGSTRVIIQHGVNNQPARGGRPATGTSRSGT